VSDVYPPVVQRPALLKLAEALLSRDNALRRDECSDWRINGKRGHIYAIPGTLDRPHTPGFQIYIGCESVREWSYAKKALAPFTDPTNDGDEEGMLFLDHLPSPNEAEIIRRYVGIAKKREVSPEELDRLRRMGTRYKSSDQTKRPASELPEAE
jgi:hypothetical protein